MADFKTRIDDLTGFASTDDTALNDWLSSGARSVMNILPLNKLERVASNENFTNNIDVEGKKILGVVRKDNNHASKIYMPARKLPPSAMGIVNDTNYMEAASESDPAFIIMNDVLNTYPGSNSANDSRVIFLNSSITVANGDSSISNFPDEAEEAVVLYASRNALNRLMNNMNSISALSVSVSAPSAPSIATVSYSAASNADASSTAVSPITVSGVDKSDISGDVPTYTKPTVSLNVTAISDLSISSSAPSVPTLSDITYTNATGLNADNTNMSAVTFGTVPSIINVSSDAPVYNPPVLNVDMTQFETFLETDEDAELAQIQLGRLNNEISQYQSKISETQAKFNADNALYQTEFNEAVQKFQADQQKVLEQARLDLAKAQQDVQNENNIEVQNKARQQELSLQNAVNSMKKIVDDNNSKLSKFSQELSLYQQNVAKEIQQYSANTDKELQLFRIRSSNDLQNYSLDIQNELNEFNKDNVRYQANVQAEIQKHNSDLQKATTSIFTKIKT